LMLRFITIYSIFPSFTIVAHIFPQATTDVKGKVAHKLFTSLFCWNVRRFNAKAQRGKPQPNEPPIKGEHGSEKRDLPTVDSVRTAVKSLYFSGPSPRPPRLCAHPVFSTELRNRAEAQRAQRKNFAKNEKFFGFAMQRRRGAN
jgi:hypothetical protein